jgi:hypothetical protein
VEEQRMEVIALRVKQFELHEDCPEARAVVRALGVHDEPARNGRVRIASSQVVCKWYTHARKQQHQRSDDATTVAWSETKNHQKPNNCNNNNNNDNDNDNDNNNANTTTTTTTMTTTTTTATTTTTTANSTEMARASNHPQREHEHHSEITSTYTSPRRTHPPTSGRHAKPHAVSNDRGSNFLHGKALRRQPVVEAKHHAAQSFSAAISWRHVST